MSSRTLLFSPFSSKAILDVQNRQKLHLNGLFAEKLILEILCEVKISDGLMMLPRKYILVSERSQLVVAIFSRKKNLIAFAAGTLEMENQKLPIPLHPDCFLTGFVSFTRLTCFRIILFKHSKMAFYIQVELLSSLKTEPNQGH